MLAVSGERAPWSRRALTLWAAIALAESLAAWQVGLREPLFYALQAGVLLGLSGALALLPSRWAGLLPLLLGGLLHLQGIALEQSSTGLALGVAGLHVVAVSLAWSRVERARGASFAAAYTVQALAAASLLFPLERASQMQWRVPVGILAVTVLPVAALLLVQGLATAQARGRLLGTLALLALLLLPPVASEHLAWAAHRRMPPISQMSQRPAASGTQRPEEPDVILIVLDTVRADRMSLYGHDRPTTPRLEELARSATVYGPAQSAGTWTLPGHASIFTGLYVSEHQAEHRPDGTTQHLAPEAVTLAERMRSDGWLAACVAANADMFVEGFGLTQGFEVKWAEAGLTRHLLVPWLGSTLVHALLGQAARRHLGPLERDEFAPATEINRLALEWLDRTGGERPRLLFLNYMEAHGQMRRAPCGAPTFGEGRSFLESDVPNYTEVMAGTADPGPEAVRRIEDWYDSQLACLDQHLGELFDELRARGLFDDALIAITSDHGQMLGENRSFHHRSEVWEGLVRVPLIVKAPGQTAPVRCEGVCESLALFTALPQLAAGQETVAPCPLPGRSRQATFALTETRRHERMVRLRPDRWDRRWLALSTPALKYAADDRRNLWVLEPDESGKHGENQRPAAPAEQAEFERLLEAWAATLAPPLWSGDGADAEERAAALRRLGYTE